MEASRQENVKIKEEKEKLEARVKELEAEINSLQVTKESAASNAEALKKAAEQTTVIVSKYLISFSSNWRFQQVALSKERDELLAEKEKWTKVNVEGAGASAWEKEKIGLVKARDEAVEKLRVCLHNPLCAMTNIVSRPQWKTPARRLKMPRIFVSKMSGYLLCFWFEANSCSGEISSSSSRPSQI